MKLPNGHRAIVDIAKLRDYCLNPEHPVGGDKARVFRSALGVTVSNAELLRERLLEAAKTSAAELVGGNDYGQLYRIDFEWEFESRDARIRSGWIVLDSDDAPRLTTCVLL